jgi:hypothetical protein
MRCPTCDRKIDANATPTVPFCSTRCREIDLGRWLTEKHSVPSLPREDDDELPPSDDEG